MAPGILYAVYIVYFLLLLLLSVAYISIMSVLQRPVCFNKYCQMPRCYAEFRNRTISCMFGSEEGSRLPANNTVQASDTACSYEAKQCSVARLCS